MIKWGGGFSAVESALSTISMPTLLKEVNLTTPATQQDIDLSDVDVSKYNALKIMFELVTNNTNTDSGTCSIGMKLNNVASGYHINDDTSSTKYTWAGFGSIAKIVKTSYVRGNILLYPKALGQVVIVPNATFDSTSTSNNDDNRFTARSSFYYNQSIAYNSLQSINILRESSATYISITSFTAKVYGYTENNLFMI